MHTIGEAAQLLGIGRVTLEKWCKRLHITPERHPQDWRYRVLSDEQVQAVRDARAQMPGKSTVTPYAPVARSQPNLSEQGAMSSRLPIVTPRPSAGRRSAPYAGYVLPDGMMSRTDVATAHNFPASTLRRWCDEGRIETDGGTYGGEHGQFQAARPVTARGLAQFYALASGRSDFRRCPDCPHSAPQTPEAVVIPPASGVASE